MVKWECPECEAGCGANHGGLGRSKAVASVCHGRGSICDGLVCECWTDDSERDDHGSAENPCFEAQCGHCGWCGEIPPKPPKLKGWRKTAWNAGWRPVLVKQ